MKTSRSALAVLALAAACAAPPPPQSIADAPEGVTPDAPADAALAALDAAPDAYVGTANLALSGSGTFGAVDLGVMVDHSFTITNHGDGASETVTLAAPGQPFAVGQDTCSGTSVAAGGTCTFDVVFQPTLAGDADGELQLEVGGATSALGVMLTGHGNSPATLQFDTTTATDLGDVQVAHTATAPLTVLDSGDDASGPLSIGSSDPAFTIVDPSSCAAHPLAARTSCKFSVQFQPNSPSTATATITVGDGTAQVQHTVIGNGLAPGAIDIIEDGKDFGAQHTYDPATSFTFHVENTGQVAIAAPTVAINGNGAAAYTPTSHCGASLQPMTSCTVDVAFAPASVGAAPASLTVTSTDGGADAAALSGTGTVHVTISRTGAGDVTSSQAGIDCGATCDGDFSVPSLDLTAHDDPTSHFLSWSNCDSSSSNICTLDLSAAPRTAAVTFQTNQYTLTVYEHGTGHGTITARGAPMACPGGVCTATFDAGTQVTVTAVPDAMSTFTSLTGATCSGSSSTCAVTITANTALDATFTLAKYTVTTNANPAAGGSVSGGGTYDAGSTVVLVATPNAGYRFGSWTGCASSTATCTLSNLAGNANVTANFTAQYTVTATASPAAGGSVLGGGTYDAGATVTLTATPNAGYRFGSWTGCASSTATCTLSNLAGNANVTANFTAQYTVTATASPAAGGSVLGGGTYDAGATVTLTATPNAGYRFGSWTGCASSTATCTLSNLAGNANVTASFTAQYTVTATASPAAGGSVTGGGTYDAGATVTLTATPSSGYAFSAWTGCASATTTCTISNLAGNATITAAFTKQYTVTTSASPTAGGSVSGGGTYLAGATVTLVATPNSGYAFSSWIGCSSTTATCTISNLSANATVTANFGAQYTVSTGASPAAGGSVSGGGIYGAGATVTLTATPNAGYRFGSWTGCASSTTTCTITNLAANATVTASFTAQYTVATSASPTAGGSVSGGGTYDAGATVTLTATPSAGYRFASWAGCSSSTATCTISNLAGNANVTAAFVAQYTVTTNANPAAGGAIVGGGTYDAGATVVLVATANAGYAFSSWTGCSSSTSTCTIAALAGNASVTASFVARYTVTTSASPSAGGTVSGGGTYNAGTTVTLTATPSTGYAFVSWTGCASSTTTCTISNLAGNASVTASFIARYTVTASASPSAGGSVSGGGTYDAGSDVTLVATPNSGYVFSSWTGCASSTATCAISNLSANASVTASFTAQYTVTTSANPAAGGSVSGAGTYLAGATVTLVATPNSGYAFSSWTGCASSTATCTISGLAGNASVTASFVARYTVTASASPSSGGSISGAGTYNAGSTVTLVAMPATGYRFGSWTGCSSSTATCTISNLAADASVTATFTRQYTVTATASPSTGGTIVGGGTYDAGSTVTLVAMPATGYRFGAWTGCSSSTATCTISNLAADASVTATFTKQYTVTASASPTAGGSVTGGGTYDAGATVTLTATVNSGYVFGSWSGCSSSTTTCSISNLSANATVTAIFTPVYTVSANTVPNAGGSVSGAGFYDGGSTVTLTATANPGYKFSSWTGCTGSTSTCTITNLSGNVTVIANFTGTLGYSASFGGDGSGSITGALTCHSPTGCASSNAYYPSTPVGLVATPDSGMLFGGWDSAGPCAGQGPSCNYTLSATRTNAVTASFFRSSYTLTLGNAWISCQNGCTAGGTYARGTAMTLFGQEEILTINPKTHMIEKDCFYDVATWSGCDSSTGDTCKLTLDANTTVDATYKTVASSCTVGGA